MVLWRSRQGGDLLDMERKKCTKHLEIWEEGNARKNFGINERTVLKEILKEVTSNDMG
jgi:hypothetical protein